MSLSLHNFFCLNSDFKLKKLLNHPRRFQEQKEWIRAYEQLKACEEIVISSDDEKELTRQITVLSASGPKTSKTSGTN